MELPQGFTSLQAVLNSIEKDYILGALEKNNGCKARVCRVLGISRATLYRKLDQYSPKGGSSEVTE